MKTISLTLFLVIMLAGQSFALGGFSSLEGNAKNVAEMLKEKLKLTEQDAYGLYMEHFKVHVNTEDWHLNISHNETLDNSRVKESDARFLNVNFVTDNRYVNMSIVKFLAENQLLIHILETLPRESSLGMKKYNELKVDDNFSILAERDYFAVFDKNGYAENTALFVANGISAAQFRSFYTYNLNSEK